MLEQLDVSRDEALVESDEITSLEQSEAWARGSERSEECKSDNIGEKLMHLSAFHSTPGQQP